MDRASNKLTEVADRLDQLSVEDWSESQVIKSLDGLGYHEAAALAAESALDGETLASLSKDELRDYLHLSPLQVRRLLSMMHRGNGGKAGQAQPTQGHDRARRADHPHDTEQADGWKRLLEESTPPSEPESKQAITT